MNKFWIYDPSILLNKYWEVLPTRNMTFVDQLNTISRFLIYLIIILVLFNQNSVILLLAIVLLVVIIIYHSLYVNDFKSIALDVNENFVDEYNKYKENNKAIIDNPISHIKSHNMIKKVSSNKVNRVNRVDGVDGVDGVDRVDRVDRVNGVDGVGGDNVNIHTAYINSNGDFVFGDLKKDSNIYGDEGIFSKDGGGGGSTYKMNNDFVDSTCRKPTVDNPYANIVFSDYLDAGNVASPCNVDDDELPKKSLELYNSTIFRSVGDVFERENSQRLFYTLPINTIPNKQTEFARWLYDTGPRCKEDTSKCTYYEDPSMTSPRY
jgi:hypothetical protein